MALHFGIRVSIWEEPREEVQLKQEFFHTKLHHAAILHPSLLQSHQEVIRNVRVRAQHSRPRQLMADLRRFTNGK